ncbi:uncharacterized protein ACBT57_020271 [Dama dama]
MDAMLGPQPSRRSPAKRRRRREGTLSAPPSSRLMAPSDTGLRSRVSLPPELSPAGWGRQFGLSFVLVIRNDGGEATGRGGGPSGGGLAIPYFLQSSCPAPTCPSTPRDAGLFAGFMLDEGGPAEEVEPSLLTASPGLQVDTASVRCGFSASDLSDIIFTPLLSMVAEGSRGSDAKGQWKVFLGHQDSR